MGAGCLWIAHLEQERLLNIELVGVCPGQLVQYSARLCESCKITDIRKNQQLTKTDWLGGQAVQVCAEFQCKQLNANVIISFCVHLGGSPGRRRPANCYFIIIRI